MRWTNKSSIMHRKPWLIKFLVIISLYCSIWNPKKSSVCAAWAFSNVVQSEKKGNKTISLWCLFVDSEHDFQFGESCSEGKSWLSFSCVFGCYLTFFFAISRPQIAFVSTLTHFKAVQLSPGFSGCCDCKKT